MLHVQQLLERRTLLDELLARLDVFLDHLEVDIRGAGTLKVALHEVGLQTDLLRPMVSEGGLELRNGECPWLPAGVRS